jgi:cyclophilin family peptidyl-prolyl cis-trans isomerase
MFFARALGRGLLAAALIASPTILFAQDEPAAAAQEDWTSLSTRFTTARTTVEKLGKEFREATAARQVEIQKEAEGPIKEIQATYSKLQKMAAERYASDPTDVLAAKIVLEQAFKAHRYAEVAKIADQILKAEPKDQLALNLGGAAHFINHDFAKAKEVLTTAADAELLTQDYAPFFQNAGEYLGFWEKEQKIRAAEDAAEGDQQLPRVEFDTTKGKIVVELFENEAPNTVANFVSLVESKFYDGLGFHRVIPMFMAQGGCPNTREGAKAQPGTGGPGYAIKCECYAPNARMHFTGSLSMAHAGKDSGGSQFFLTHLPTAHLNADAAAQKGHTVFGRVVEGLDAMQSLEVGDQIKSAKVLRKRNHEYKPETLPDPKSGM